jgi:hypothetical protein
MNIIHYPADRLSKLFRNLKVATLPKLKTALGTTVDMTVMRKLATDILALISGPKC